MGLTDHERQALEELERSLLESGGVREPRQALVSDSELGPRRILVGVLISSVGLAGLLAAAITRVPLLGLLGFLVMGSGLVVASSRRRSSTP